MALVDPLQQGIVPIEPSLLFAVFHSQIKGVLRFELTRNPSPNGKQPTKMAIINLDVGKEPDITVKYTKLENERPPAVAQPDRLRRMRKKTL